MSKVNAIGTVCHAPGDRCLGCKHYYGKAEVCEYADNAAAGIPTPPLGITLQTVDEFLGLREGTIDNAAGQVSHRTRDFPTTDVAASIAPAAPTQTPWTDSVDSNVAPDTLGSSSWRHSYLVITKHAERLEHLVHQQHEALSISRGQWIHSVNKAQCLAALAAYVALEKEIEK